MERKKHKRLNDTIMKPEDLKKSRVKIQKVSNIAGPSTSSATGGGIKAKLDFRTTTVPVQKSNLHLGAQAGSLVQSSHVVRPIVDDRWKEFGETINLNIDTFAKSIKESVELDKFNKVARMLVAALKSFIVGDKLKVELRLLGTIAETIKSHGDKLNHVHLHRGLLYMISNSRAFPDNILQLFLSMTTCLAKQQPMLDKCYIAAFLHDAIGVNTGLGTANRCAWIEKPYAQELVKMIMSPFATIFPDDEMYPACQVEGLTMAEYIPKERYAERESLEQLAVFLEFLKPWFDNIRGEVLPKPLFRALCLLCGYDHVRFFIASRLDVWITLQKFHREISELLLVLGCNLNADKDLDKDVIDILLKLNTKNMKTRTISGPFSVAIRKACEQPTNVHAVFESLIHNETGPPQNRSPANLPTMFMLLTFQAVESTKALAMVCTRELIRERDGCIKMLRSFLRELIRAFNHTKSGEFPFSVFAETMLNAMLKRGEANAPIGLKL
uniref:DUF3677 domain-containing protein n=1 Tax=Caenorhabditis japonica TaxID=281687 RepID=A0A8R1DQJ5_CAEJA